MRRIFTLLLVGALLAVFPSDLFAQKALLRYADKQYELFNYQEASEVYVKAFGRKHSYKAANGAAKSFQRINDYKESYEWWKTTIAFEKSNTKDFANFISAAHQLGKIDEVKVALDTLAKKNEVVDHINIDSLMYWYQHPKRVKAILLDSLNSPSTDFGVTEDSKGNFYFASDRGEVKENDKAMIRLDLANEINENQYGWTGRDFLTVYRVNKDGDIDPMASPVPFTYHFSDPFFMKEKPVVFYTVTREMDEKARKKFKKKNRVNPEMDYGQGKNQYTDYHSEVFYSEISDSGEFKGFKTLPFNSSLEYSVINPFLDEQNKLLYFASDMPGGFGGYDLYKVSYDEELNFGQPQNLGSKINSSGNERDPFLEGNKFYFSSDGHLGLGGLDIFSAKIQNGDFLEINNMGMPYNSAQDDFALTLGKEGNQYLSSNRMGGEGMDDLYFIKAMYRRFLARVLDCDGNLVTDGYMADLIKRDDKQMVQYEKGEDGQVKASVAPDTDYELKIEKRGYFPIIDPSISTKGMEGELIEKEYTLIPIPYNLSVYSDLIFYDLDKDAIRGDAKPALRKLAQMMKKYPFLVLKVRSHTDARASEDYNKKLSKRRADAVAAYLSEQGVEKQRVKEASYGENELANDCGDGVPCPESDHQINRRSELVLNAFPDESKQYEIPEALRGIDLCEEPNLGIPVEIPIIHFDFDKYYLRLEDKMELERLLVLMKERPESTLSLEGHTDIRGSEAYNEILSKKRAQVVLDYLVERGLGADRIEYTWFGKSQPIYPCNNQDCTEEEHQMNRRTVIRLVLGNEKYAPSIENPERRAEIGKVKKRENNIFIVAGAFTKEENANDLIQEIKSMGYVEAGYFYGKERGLYYCYLNKFQEEKMARSFLAKVDEPSLKNSWILFP